MMKMEKLKVMLQDIIMLRSLKSKIKIKLFQCIGVLSGLEDGILFIENHFYMDSYLLEFQFFLH